MNMKVSHWRGALPKHLQLSASKLLSSSVVKKKRVTMSLKIGIYHPKSSYGVESPPSSWVISSHIQLIFEDRTRPPKDRCCSSRLLFLILCTVDTQNCLFHFIFAATFYVLEGCFQIISLAPISLFKIRQTHFSKLAGLF